MVRWFLLCKNVKVSRDRIVAGTAPWMAAQDALDAQPAAFEDAVFEHGFHHILAARRRIAAGRRRERRDENPVEIDGQQKSLAHNYFPFIFFSALHTAFSMVAKDCSSLSM